MSPSVRRPSSEVLFLTTAGGSQQKYFDLTMSPSKVAVSKYFPHKKQKPVTVQTQDGQVGNTSSMCESLRKPISRNRWQFNKHINKANDSRESPCGWNRLGGQRARVIQTISPGFVLSCNAYTADYHDCYCTPMSPTFHLLLHSKKRPPHFPHTLGTVSALCHCACCYFSFKWLACISPLGESLLSLPGLACSFLPLECFSRHPLCLFQGT